jgi:hypothetical protein
MSLPMNGIAEQIKQLELKLLHLDLKTEPELINDLLSHDFEEISQSGKINTRRDVVDWLIHKDIHLQWSLNDFRIRMLADELVMAMYTAQKMNDRNNLSKGSMRTSIWQRQGGTWKMIFHQASKITD